MHLYWQPAFSTSCLHAAWACQSGLPLADERVQAAVGEAEVSLSAALSESGVPSDLFWRHLLGLSPSLASNRDLAEAVLRKSVGAGDERYPPLVPRVERAIDQIESGMRLVFPKMEEELALRLGPLKEQWESRGPGLLGIVTRLTEPGFLVEDATILLVQPALGGGGMAHLQYNAVRIEAVLANPLPQLPEAVRLGWLVSQLNCDLPRYADEIHGSRLELVSALALLPIVLAAGQEVEWVPPHPAIYEQALAAWFVSPAFDPAATADILRTWWQTYQAMRPNWAVALTALDRMLPR